MDNIIRGKLNRWDDAKGFGFISPEDRYSDVFIHISAFANMTRRPVIGDVIYFQLQNDPNGKSRAINAMIEGVPRVRQTADIHRSRASRDSSRLSRFIWSLVCLTICSVLIVRSVQNRSGLQPPASMPPPATYPTAPVPEPAAQPTVSTPAPKTHPKAPELAISSDQVLENAYINRQSDIQVQGKGSVIKILSDDLDGSRHQRFILRLNSGRTVLVAHNIDLAPRLGSLSMGDPVGFFGEYEWNSKGGVVHWTHRDPKGLHEAGWLKHGGETYQ